MQDTKNCQKFATWAPSHNFVGLYLCNQGTYRQSEKNLLNSNISPTRLHNMVNFGPLVAEICWRVWGTPTNFIRFQVLAALLHGTQVVGIIQTLWHWTEVPPICGRAAITLGIAHISTSFCLCNKYIGNCWMDCVKFTSKKCLAHVSTSVNFFHHC